MLSLFGDMLILTINNMSKEIQPTQRVRHDIIRDNEESPYVIMKMLYALAPAYYDKQYFKYNQSSNV